MTNLSLDETPNETPDETLGEILNETLDPQFRKHRASRLLIFLTTLLVFILSFGIHAIWVSGQSMHPTIENRDVCWVYSRLLFWNISINRGDIVTLDHGDKILVKRVIGIPGDDIVIGNGIVLVNGALDNNPSVLFDYTNGTIHRHLGRDEYFVLGDNRPISLDSRSFGAVRRDKIRAKVVLAFHNPIIW